MSEQVLGRETDYRVIINNGAGAETGVRIQTTPVISKSSGAQTASRMKLCVHSFFNPFLTHKSKY